MRAVLLAVVVMCGLVAAFFAGVKVAATSAVEYPQAPKLSKEEEPFFGDWYEVGAPPDVRERIAFRPGLEYLLWIGPAVKISATGFVYPNGSSVKLAPRMFTSCPAHCGGTQLRYMELVSGGRELRYDTGKKVVIYRRKPGK